MSEPHYHDRIMSVSMDLQVPKDITGMTSANCPLFKGTDCKWDFIDPLPDGTHQLRYVKNTPTNATPVTT